MTGLSSSITTLALLSTTLLACGGSGKPPTSPEAPEDVAAACAAGVTMAGPAPTPAATWDAVRAAVGEGLDGCDGCGPTAPVSVVGDSGAVVLYDGRGYHVQKDLWASYDQAPTVAITPLADLTRIAVTFELLGREEACLDGEDPESTDCHTATVVMGTEYIDLVVEPSSGAIVWQARCSLDGDAAGQPTSINRAGDRYSYTSCVAGAAPVTFTVSALSACTAPAIAR